MAPTLSGMAVKVRRTVAEQHQVVQICGPAVAPVKEVMPLDPRMYVEPT
jgi:hypothetical protein